MNSLKRPFLRESARYLRDVYMPRLTTAARTLPEADLWWRPHEGALSLGNILLHLEGNVRQWILCGLGRRPDERVRAEEFSARDGAKADALLRKLGETVGEAGSVIESFPEADLLEPLVLQGTETTGFAAIYHVVEHFSWHTGQAVWIAKERAGESHGLAFYDDAVINRARNA